LGSVIRLAVVVAAIALQGCGGGGDGAEPAAVNTIPTVNTAPTENLVSATQIASVTKAQAAVLFTLAQVPLVPAYDVKIYKIVYRTSDASGAPINASGALVVPQNLAAPAPLLSSQHGTTTLKSDVAS